MVFTFGTKLRSPVYLNLKTPAMHCATAVWLFKHFSFISNCAVSYKTVTYILNCTHACKVDLPRRS